MHPGEQDPDDEDGDGTEGGADQDQSQVDVFRHHGVDLVDDEGGGGVEEITAKMYNNSTLRHSSNKVGGVSGSWAVPALKVTMCLTLSMKMVCVCEGEERRHISHWLPSGG